MSDTQADKAADSSSIASARRRDHRTAPIFAALALVYPTTRWSIEMWRRDFVPHPALLRSDARAAMPAGPIPASTVRFEAATCWTGNYS